MLGAYVKKLDRSSCIEVPGGFGCSDRVVSDLPINKISVLLHASPRNREYYFGRNESAECDPDDQCAAYKFLRRTLYATANARRWPDSEDVLLIRNSPYACVLAYAGLGDADAVGVCHSQLGDNCFDSEGNRFCVGNSRTAWTGLTNADEGASAPLAICEVSDPRSMAGRGPAYAPTPEEVRDFVAPSSCDATVLWVDKAVYEPSSSASKPGHLSLALDAAAFLTLAGAGHVIMKVPFDQCLIPASSTESEFAAAVRPVAETLVRATLSTHSVALLLDAGAWGRASCSRAKDWRGMNLTSAAELTAAALVGEGAGKLFLGLPRSRGLLSEIDFSKLSAFEAFVTPRGSADIGAPRRCQNMWVDDSTTRAASSDQAVMPYLMTLLRRGVRANRIIFTLSLTGRLKLSSIERGGGTEAEVQGELTLADMETNTALKCEENIDTKCCRGSSSSVWGRGVMVNVTVASTSFETLKRFPELVAVAFGVNQFVIAPVDSDFKRGVRSDTPAILGITSAVHRLRDWKRQQIAAGISTGDGPGSTRTRSLRSARAAAPRSDDSGGMVELTEIVITIPENQYKDPASGSKNCLDPRYNVGLSNTIVCPGLIATHGALGIFKEPHKELYGTSYDKIYIADLYKLDSCTPGEPSRRAAVSSKAPQVAININTLVPTTDSKHYMVGILDSDKPVEYVPPVNKVCVAHNTGESSQSLNVVSVDDGYAVDKPMVESDHGVIVKPAEALHFVSNFTPGIDYINLNVSCVNYDVSALRPCLIAVCGGDESCRRDYGRLCNSAHEIVNDARRAGDMMREGLRELATQELKASMYAMPDGAPFPQLSRPEQARGGRRKRFLGMVLGGAALGLAIHVSTRVDSMQAQMDMLKESYVDVSGRLVEVSNRLQANVALIDGRIDEQERKMKRNTEIANNNFAMLRDAMKRNTEAALRDTNVKFSVMASYQMWYAQMQSVTHQMMQAAMHTKFMARGVENCLRQIASKRSGSCPSGMSVMREHPGLSEFPTVGAALYKDRKLFIVHSVPRTIERSVVRGIIPIPKMSTDGVPCWPDYNVWLIDGQFYEPSECHGRYCVKPELHERYSRCVKDPGECKTVCGPCHRGICYRDNKVTWMEGSATVEIDSPPLKPFSRPHISDGPVSFSDLLKDAVPGVPEIELLEAINTSVKLASVHEDLENITRDLREFDRRYEEITASRVSLGGWLSGFASDAALWVSIAVLTTWCGALSAVIAYVFFCGGAGGAGGAGGSEVLLPRYAKRLRSKML